MRSSPPLPQPTHPRPLCRTGDVRPALSRATRLATQTLSGALEDSLVSVQHVLSRPAAAEELMEDLQEGMESEGVSLRHLWDKADPKRRGYLDYGEV